MIYLVKNYLAIDPNQLPFEFLAVFVILSFAHITSINSNLTHDHMCISNFPFLTIPFSVLILVPIVSLYLDMLSSLRKYFSKKQTHVLVYVYLPKNFQSTYPFLQTRIWTKPLCLPKMPFGSIVLTPLLVHSLLNKISQLCLLRRLLLDTRQHR